MECTVCAKKLPKDGKARIRVRARCCKHCKGKIVLWRRQTDPVKALHHRFYNNVRRIWPASTPEREALLSIDITRATYERWAGKSVISGESDPLCVSWLHKHTPKCCVPSESELVLLTTHEAQSLARAPTDAKRLRAFPEHIINRITPPPSL